VTPQEVDAILADPEQFLAWQCDGVCARILRGLFTLSEEAWPILEGAMHAADEVRASGPTDSGIEALYRVYHQALEIEFLDMDAGAVARARAFHTERAATEALLPAQEARINAVQEPALRAVLYQAWTLIRIRSHILASVDAEHAASDEYASCLTEMQAQMSRLSTSLAGIEAAGL
jgi:hypothetical protein